jgi:hypothetical protein
MHHWAALVFVAAIGIHLLRIFFTGAFRRPREVNWTIGVTLFWLSILEGFCGYSMPDDLRVEMPVTEWQRRQIDVVRPGPGETEDSED